MAAEPELLDIAQAAGLLQVSEASLRRWTNGGQLPCLRVGGRRERRFRRADLMAFLEGHQTHKLASHVCGLYTSDVARARQAAGVLAIGLERGGVCFLAAQPEVREGVLARLALQRASLPRDLEVGRLVFLEYAEHVATQLERWETQWDAAMRDGVRSLNVVGDVSGGRLAREGSFDQILEYETEYVKMSRRFPVATTCLYDARLYSGLETVRLLGIHPDLFHQPVTHLVG
jgi:transcriptional repressor of dcmA and dcmR